MINSTHIKRRRLLKQIRAIIDRFARLRDERLGAEIAALPPGSELARLRGHNAMLLGLVEMFIDWIPTPGGIGRSESTTAVEARLVRDIAHDCLIVLSIVAPYSSQLDACNHLVARCDKILKPAIAPECP